MMHRTCLYRYRNAAPSANLLPNYNVESNEEFWEVMRAFLYPGGLPPGLPPKVGGSAVAPKTSRA